MCQGSVELYILSCLSVKHIYAVACADCRLSAGSAVLPPAFCTMSWLYKCETKLHFLADGCVLCCPHHCVPDWMGHSSDLTSSTYS